MTDLRNDLSSLLVKPGATTTPRSPAAVNPYAAPEARSVEPVRSDPYAALRQDAEEREANDFGLPSISSLPSVRNPDEETERVIPPEPVLSEAVLVAAGLLEPEVAPTVDGSGTVDGSATAESATPDPGATDIVTADSATTTEVAPTEVVAGLAAGLSEVSFSDFVRDEREPAEEADLTEIFAGLDAVTPADAVWRRGDDDIIGSGSTASRSAKRRSLRLRRRAA